MITSRGRSSVADEDGGRATVAIAGSPTHSHRRSLFLLLVLGASQDRTISDCREYHDLWYLGVRARSSGRRTGDQGMAVLRFSAPRP